LTPLSFKGLTHICIIPVEAAAR